MRKLIIAAVLVLACVLIVFAGPKSEHIRIDLGTATAYTNTATDITGYIEEILVTCGTATSTGTVTVSVSPPDGATDYNIATNVVVGSKRWRPVEDTTDIGGTAVTGDEPVRYALAGDTLRFIVIGSPTNEIWMCRVKVSDN